MTFTHPHERNDWISLETARCVARRLRENPALVAEGTRRDFSAYREWDEIIQKRSVGEIADILESETEEGQRLRSSRPFSGSLFATEQERTDIIERAFAG